MNKPPFHPMLCALFNSSIQWIEKTTDLNNRDKSVQQIADENDIVLDQLNQTNPFNPALLISAAYLFFLYPKESKHQCSAETSDFTIVEGEDNDLKRRLRNSIAHGNYTFLDGNIIEFTDSNNGRNFIKFRISFSDFGRFINKCLTNSSTLR